MTRAVFRHPARLAWPLWMIFVLLTAILFVLLWANEQGRGVSLLTMASLSVALGAFATVGALISSRRPENPLGWLFLATALVTQLSAAGEEYGRYALVSEPGSVPWGVGISWVSHWLFGVGIELIVFVLLLFPTGRLPSKRWRPLFWVAVTAVVAFALDSAFVPGPLPELPFRLLNPLGIEGSESFFTAFESVANGFLIVSMIGAVLSMIKRARASRGDERQQLKWFGYGAATMLVAAFPLNALVTAAAPDVGEVVGGIMFVFGVAILPIVTGIAILKYRLYEIDVIVNRTLVYGLLSAAIAGIYLGSVFLLQGLLGSFTADSDIAVAGSTLAVAAAFRPLRSRIQNFIDHRFYRRKYDAAGTLEQFSLRLRDKVELGSLINDLVAVVGSTMQPAHASLWLRQAEDDHASVAASHSVGWGA